MSLIDDFIESPSVALSPSYIGNTSSFLDPTGFEHADPVHMLETGFVSTGLAKDDSEIFSLDLVQFQFPAPLVAMSVSNEILVMALETNHILRIDLQQAHDVEDIEIPRKPEVKIYKIFFDPTGRHLLITTEQGENFYLFEKWKKAKVLSKFKGVIIESVGWNRFNGSSSDTSTKKILIGSRNGLIFEAEIEPTDEYFKKAEKFWKQVYSLNRNIPITGLRIEQFPATSRKYLIVATTPTRLYQFIGNTSPSKDDDVASMFENLFANYASNPVFQELPGDLNYSELQFYSQYQYQDLQYQGAARNFAWLTNPGIYHGSLVFGSQDVGDSVIDSAKLLPYPTTSSNNDMSAEVPLSIALTEFHFILLYKERVKAICQLNDQVVFDDIIPLKAGEEVRTMTVDNVKNTFWIYTDSSIFELIVSREDRDVWKLYLEKQQFDTALQYVKNPAQRDKVLTTQAEHYFSQKRYLLSASYYAESTVPFEEVALKFVERDERDALRKYLLNKLDKLRRQVNK